MLRGIPNDRASSLGWKPPRSVPVDWGRVCLRTRSRLRPSLEGGIAGVSTMEKSQSAGG
jgi:hypothetical protein